MRDVECCGPYPLTCHVDDESDCVDDYDYEHERTRRTADAIRGFVWGDHSAHIVISVMKRPMGCGECVASVSAVPVSGFVIRVSGLIRISDFGFRVCSSRFATSSEALE